MFSPSTPTAKESAGVSAARLQQEGLSRLNTDTESALVALKQAFALECQFYSSDGERLCRSCAALCRGLAHASAPSPPAEAVAVLLQALDTLDETAEQAAAFDFLVRELLGLARKLSGGTGGDSQPGSPHVRDPTGYGSSPPGSPKSRPTAGNAPPPGLSELRAADRAYERLAQCAASTPLRIGPAGSDLLVTQQELLFQHSQQAKAIGQKLMAQSGMAAAARDVEAATFYYARALRKLRLAGIADKDPRSLELKALIREAEAHAERLRAPVMASGGGGGGVGGRTAADAKAAEASSYSDDYCSVS